MNRKPQHSGTHDDTKSPLWTAHASEREPYGIAMEHACTHLLHVLHAELAAVAQIAVHKLGTHALRVESRRLGQPHELRRAKEEEDR